MSSQHSGAWEASAVERLSWVILAVRISAIVTARFG